MASGTPTAQVRITLTGPLFFFEPPLLLTSYYLGKNYKGASANGRWRQKNYAAAEYKSCAGAGEPKVRKKLTVPKIVAQ